MQRQNETEGYDNGPAVAFAPRMAQAPQQSKMVSYAKYGYIFCIPFMLAFLVFMLYPLLFTFTISFTDLRGLATSTFSMLRNSDGQLDPFGNFTTILGFPGFRTAMYNTFFIWIVNFIPQIVLALLFTAWFTNRHNPIKAQGFFKVMFYLPNIITAASIAVLFSVLFMFPVGPINDTLVRLGLRDEAFQFTGNKLASQLIVAFIQFWMWYGYTMLILISGVLGLNPEMYEVSEIDGANGVQQFFYITLPNLRTILLYTLVTSMVGGLNMFDIPRLFNNGNPDNATRTLSLFIYTQAFSGQYMYNRAAAASLLVFLIILVLAAIIFFLMRDKDAIKEKKLIRDVARAKQLAMEGGDLL
jgi:multiple sugar transport system permease protein